MYTWLGLPVASHMHGTSSPFPGMLERYHLSVTLYVIVLFLAKKYQQTLDVSLGTCPTVFASTYHCRWSQVAMVCLCSRLLHMVTSTLVHCFVICVRCRWTQMTRHHRQSRTSRLPAILGGCVGVQYPVVGCYHGHFFVVKCRDVTNIRPSPCLSTK